MKVDEIISKSLNDLDAVLESIKNEETTEDLTKGLPMQNNKQPNPEDVSKETPENTEEGNEEQQEEEPEEGNEEQNEEQDTDEDTEKSLDLKADDNVRKALEVSDFLTGLVNGLTNTIKTQNDSLTKSIKTTEDATLSLAKSFEGIAKAQKVTLELTADITKSIKALRKDMELIKSQPMNRKSVASSKVEVIEKSFTTGDNKPAKTDKLTKSQASNILMQKHSEGNTALMGDILALEGTGDFGALSDMAKGLLGLK